MQPDILVKEEFKPMEEEKDYKIDNSLNQMTPDVPHKTNLMNQPLPINTKPIYSQNTNNSSRIVSSPINQEPSIPGNSNNQMNNFPPRGTIQRPVVIQQPINVNQTNPNQIYNNQISNINNQ